MDDNISNESSAGDWYVAYTKHQHEMAVARALASRGFDTLLPVYSTTRVWKTGKKVLNLPLFPCYVFIRGKLERRREIITTPGIHTLVSQAGKPCPIPPAEIHAIQQAAKSGCRLAPYPLLQCGELVRIKNGPMVGVEGILERKKNTCKLIISVEMLGKAAAVEIDSSAVERIRPSVVVRDVIRLGDRKQA
jgi:transcription antitermination factor NusG